MKGNSWKTVERALAKALGGVRLPVSGRHSGGPDIQHDRFCIEVKSRRRLPALLQAAMCQAVRAARPSGKVPLVIVHEQHAAHTSDFVVMRFQDFLTLTAGERENPDGLPVSPGSVSGSY